MENHLSALLVLRQYIISVRDNGTPCDVASLAEPLRARSQELKKFDVAKRIKLASNNMVVSFVPAFGRRHTGNLLGSLEEKIVFKGACDFYTHLLKLLTDNQLVAEFCCGTLRLGNKLRACLSYVVAESRNTSCSAATFVDVQLVATNGSSDISLRFVILLLSSLSK